jgi:Response regulator containing CheY-like receiver domain and AraC-type DNA-binding domain
MKYTVIIAEDEELLLHSLAKKIESLDVNFEVIGKAQTGVQAYELVKQLSPDLVITDIRMPEMNGITLLQKLRETYPLLDFIITSGYSDFEYAKSAIHLQVSEYLLKPIDPDELKTALLRLKNKYELQQNSFYDIFNSSTARSTPYEIASMLKDYLIQNYNKDVNFNLIANNMNYSSSYLTKIFYQYFECSPSKYLISLRIQKAQHLLLHNQDLTIRQVGESVGYDDQGYFSRIFKKQTGVSPLEYRCDT